MNKRQAKKKIKKFNKKSMNLIDFVTAPGRRKIDEHTALLIFKWAGNNSYKYYKKFPR